MYSAVGINEAGIAAPWPEARAHHSVHSHPNGPLLHSTGLRGCVEGRGLPPARPSAATHCAHYCHCNTKINVSNRQGMYAVKRFSKDK